MDLLVLGGLVVAGAGGPAVLAAAWAAPYLPVVLLAGYTLGRVHAVDTSGSGAHAFTPKAYWAFTAPRAVASVAQLALQRVDVLLLAALGSLHAAGLYAVAGKYVVLSQVAGGGLSQAVQPRLAERLAVGDVDGVRALYQQATAWLILATWPVHLIVAGERDRLPGTVRTVLSRRCDRGVDPRRRRCWWPPAAAWSTWCSSMGGRTRWNLYNVLAALSTMVVLDVVLIPAVRRRRRGARARGRRPREQPRAAGPDLAHARRPPVRPAHPARRRCCRSARAASRRCSPPPPAAGAAAVIAASAAGATLLSRRRVPAAPRS